MKQVTSFLFRYLALTALLAILPAGHSYLLAQTMPRPGQNRDRISNFGDEEFGQLLDDENSPDSVDRNEQGQLLLEPNPEEIYGPSTSTFIYEQDWLENRKLQRYIDTTLNYLHRYNYVARNRYMMQDLGTLGTAIQSLYFREPEEVGFRMGLEAIDPYLIDNYKVEYRDTKSPYSRWYYVQGGSGRSILDIDYSQNINPRLNVSLKMLRINSRLLVGTEPANRNDRQVTHETYMASTRFVSENGKYRLLANISHFRHRMSETGGIQLQPEDSVLLDSYVLPQGEVNTSSFDDISELFELGAGELSNRLETVGGQSAEGDTRRQQSHLYHEYTLLGKDDLQVYHTFNWAKRSYTFTDPVLQSHLNSGLYPEEMLLLPDNASSYTHTIAFRHMENQAGLKGNADKLFYTIYLGRNDYAYRFQFDPSVSIPRELEAQNYFGFRGTYALTPELQFKGIYKGLLGGEYVGNYVYAEMNTPWFVAYHKRVNTQPDLMSEYYYGNFFRWNHLPGSPDEFSNVNYTTTEAWSGLRFNKLYAKPFVKYSTFTDYIYYDTEALPAQFGEQIGILQAGIDLKLQLGPFHQDLYALYTNSQNSDIIRVPEFLVNYNFYLQVPFPGRTMLSRFGIDLHWHSEFFADAYMPVTQQFHLQNDIQLGNYLQSDLYWSFNMKKVNMFLKVSNIAQGLISGGYYLTPLYMAQPREFEFGLTWMFFD